MWQSYKLNLLFILLNNITFLLPKQVPVERATCNKEWPKGIVLSLSMAFLMGTGIISLPRKAGNNQIVLEQPNPLPLLQNGWRVRDHREWENHLSINDQNNYPGFNTRLFFNLLTNNMANATQTNLVMALFHFT